MEEETRTRFLSRLRKQTDRLSNLVSDLLNLSRLEGAEEAEHVDLDLREPVRLSVGHLQPAAEEKGLVVAATLPDAAVRVSGDAEGLRQVVDNLLQNAIGQATAHVRTRRKPARNAFSRATLFRFSVSALLRAQKCSFFY